MQTRKMTRNWAIAVAVSAMLAASAAGVRAQDATMTPAPDAAAAPAAAPTPDATMTPAPDAAMPAAPMSSMPMSSDSMSPMMPGAIDYKILANPLYDYVDLQQAKARGLSDSQIATIAKIAKKSDTPFRTVSAAVERGETFPALATMYGLRIADVYDSEKEKTEIANYKMAYESFDTKKAMMSGDMSKPMMDDMSAKPMDDTKPMSEKPMSEKPMSEKPMEAPAMATMDIVETAMAAKNLTTLVKALQLAGLVETLKGAGPFTVFAPDDKAFSKLPAGDLDALMADPAKLKMVLTYHVLPASVDSMAAKSMSSPTTPPTVEGATLQVTKGRRGKLKVNDANVTKADIHATNGIIHIIDKVLMPPMDTMTPAMPDTTMPAAPAPDMTAPAAPAPDTTAPAAPAPAAPAAP